MPAYNFQKQFVQKILDGSKTHTIRRRRKYPTKEGDILSLYTGMRTKQCQLIVEAICLRIEPITIWPAAKKFAANIQDDLQTFVQSDGFETVEQFFEFFARTYKEYILNDFEIIFWDPKKMIKAEEFISRQCKCAAVEVRHG